MPVTAVASRRLTSLGDVLPAELLLAKHVGGRLFSFTWVGLLAQIATKQLSGLRKGSPTTMSFYEKQYPGDPKSHLSPCTECGKMITSRLDLCDEHRKKKCLNCKTQFRMMFLGQRLCGRCRQKAARDA